MIVAATEESIRDAAALLKEGKLVSFPTETVYGLGANALNPDAIKHIYEVKGRPSNNPLIVHCATLDSLLALVDPDASRDIIESIRKVSVFWPGPLTVVVLKNSIIPDTTTAGNTSVALRIPRHPVALALLRSCDFPLAAPSANLSTYISPTLAQHVEEGIGDKIPMILDGGATSVGIESTVLSLLNPKAPRILRPGAISGADIEGVLGANLKVTADETSTSPTLLSPGMMTKHYAPKTKMQFLKEVDLWALPPIRIGLIAFSEGLHLDFDFHAIKVLSSNGDLSKVAAALFSALREMDCAGLDLILIDSCIETGVGKAIMDRLKRAVS